MGLRSPAPSGSPGPLDDATLWRHLQRLVDRVTATLESETVVDDCLDIVVELLGADRGLVMLEQDDGLTRVINARGARGTLSPAEREEQSRTIIRQAIESDSVVCWNAATQPLDSLSVRSLGISAAIVAPIRPRGVRRAIFYVDFRAARPPIEPPQVEFFRASVAVIAGTLDQAAATQVVRDRLTVAQGNVTERRQTPPLEELLQFEGLRRVRGETAVALAGDSPVLVLGESGIGKTLFTQALAEASGRKPIVRVVLGGSDDLNTITSELFGHERGAFSGAASKRVGLVEFAHGGTLLLDEVLNLPLSAQKLLLDFTQFGSYRPLGYDRPEPKHSHVRIIAATNGDLRAAVRDGRFREDLFYRLAGVTISLPPLRERLADIPSLAEGSLRGSDPSRAWTLSLDLRRRLASGGYAWPGNVRELEWTIRRARDRALVRDRGATVVGVEDLGELASAAESIRPPPPAPTAQRPPAEEDTWAQLQERKTQLEAREVAILREALERHDYVVAHAAKELGIARTTLAGRVEALRLSRR